MQDMTRTIGRKLALFFCTAVVCASLLSAVLERASFGASRDRENEENARALAAVMARSLQQEGENRDAARIRLLDAFHKHTGAVYMRFSEVDGSAVVELGHGEEYSRDPQVDRLLKESLKSRRAVTATSGDTLFVAAPVQDRLGGGTGSLVVALSRKPATGAPGGRLFVSLIVAVGLLAWGAGVAFHHYVVVPSLKAITRMIAGVESSAEKVFDAAGNLVSTSPQGGGQEQQSARLHETSIALGEISTAIRLNAKNADLANNVTQDTEKAAGGGVAAVGRLVNAMSQIRKSSASMANILSTIDTIAFQTNLLSLNAAVEAARAGDAGRGFAVVANEVRELAIRSAEAASETSKLIGESQANAETAGAASSEVEELLHEISEHVREVKKLVESFHADCQVQEMGIEQARSALSKLDPVAGAAESATDGQNLSEALSHHVQNMKELQQALGGAGSEVGTAVMSKQEVAWRPKKLAEAKSARTEEVQGSEVESAALPPRRARLRKSRHDLKPEQVIPLTPEEVSSCELRSDWTMRHSKEDVQNNA